MALPQFKGHAGWEFTDISSLDLAAYEPAGVPEADSTPAPMFEPDAVAELRQVDGGEAALTGELPEGVIVASLELAAREHPELVSRHLGAVVSPDDAFVARNEAGFRGGAFVYVPRGVAVTRPILLTAAPPRANAANKRGGIMFLICSYSQRMMR